MLRLEDETRRIVTFVFAQKESTGAFPTNLSGYSFQDHKIKPYVNYRRSDDQNDFDLNYYVGTPNTSHTFSSRRGWSYYPD